MSSETIFAVATPRGTSGVAVVRMSGPAAGDALESLSGPLPSPRLAALRVLKDRDGQPIDKGLVLWFPAPASFTGEDCAEFHVHGGIAVLDALCEELGRYGRAAEPGEFTRVAFRNHKLDLVEVEGLADLLAAQGGRQRLQAMHHLLGGASRAYEGWRRELLSLLARVEASVDFSEEDDVAAEALRGVSAGCWRLAAQMREALEAAAGGRAVRDGLKVVIAGAPNTGKSSLMNALLQREAAIVSARPGTTRDVIEAPLVVGGVPIQLLDTAGLRRTSDDEIEVEGMTRARAAAQTADAVLWISAPDVDGSAPPPVNVPVTIWMENKADLSLNHSIRSQNDSPRADLRVSVHTGFGMAELRARLTRLVEERCGQSELPVIVRARQAQSVSRAIQCLETAAALDGGPTELIGEELRAAAVELGRITGHIDVEDLLGEIFSSFCIGK